jgi:hypothetical protein
MTTLPSTTPPRLASPIELDWDALEIAVERNAPDTESYLDLTTGRVVVIMAGDTEAPARRQQVGDNLRNYLRVEPASSREQYRWMERFVGSVSDEALRERLIISIDGKGAFRRFKDVLLAYPAERERWFSYRAELLHWHIHNWLGQHGVVSASPCPWGPPQAPQDLPAVPGRPVVHGTESPGESLRRQARELVEALPAIELPGVIAYLEFLRARAGERPPAPAGERDDELDAAHDRVRDGGGERPAMADDAGTLRVLT